MGVQFLSSFLGGRNYVDKCLPFTKLHDCTVVLDGNNFAYSVYDIMPFELRTHNAYGGDYDIYAQFVRQRLMMLTDCNISIIVLFDGVPKDKKSAAELTKPENTIKQLGHKLSKGDTGVLGSIHPMFLVPVFREVLRELNILQMTCDHKADNNMVSVANQVQGMVISNDADFFIFECQQGFLPLKHIEWKVHVEFDGLKKYIKARQYNIQNFLAEFTIPDVKYLTLLPSLVGNFHDPANDTAKFVHKNTGVDPTQKTCSHKKIARLLIWLSRISSVSSAIAEIVRTEQDLDDDSAVNENSLFKKLMQASLEFDIPDKIKGMSILCSEPYLQLESSLTSFRNQRLPKHMYQLYQNGCLLKYVMAVICQRSCILSSHVEQITESSPHQCAAHLRTILYTIATSVDSKIEAASDITVTEYNREQASLIAIERKSVQSLSDGKALPTLLQLQEQPDAARYDVLLSCLEYHQDAPDDTQWSRFITMFIAVLRYWQSHTSTKINLTYVAAVVLSFIKLSVVESSQKVQDLYGDGIPILSSKQRISVSDRLNAFPDVPNGFDLLKVHRLAELQAIMRVVYCLNSMLCAPVCIPQMHHIYKGTFIYHLICILDGKTAKEILQYAEKLLVVPALVQLFNHMIDNVVPH